MSTVSDRRVLVTGSSRGIGREIAKRLAADGWKVAIHFSQSQGEAESLATELGSQAIETFQAALDEPSSTTDLFAAVTATGKLDAVVNNAGAYLPINFAEASMDELLMNFKKTFKLNFEAPFRLTKLAVDYFVDQGGGKIVNVASRVGFKGEARAATYAASKAALINLTRSLAVELADKRIGVFAIAPGWVDTAMVRDGMNDRLPAILETLPLGRMASPKDCAAAISFLLSDDASYLSGQTIDINGASYFH